MGIKIRTAQFAVNTSTGTQDFTISGFGASGTVKAAMFSISAGTTAGTEVAHAVLSFGFTDGTNDRCTAMLSRDALATSDTYHRWFSDACIAILATADGTVDGEAAFDSFITNGVRINWGNAPSAAFLMNVTLYGDDGSDLSVAVGDADSPATTAAAATDVSVGFTPDQIIVISPMNTTAVDTSAAEGAIGIGFIDNGASLVQVGHTFHANDVANRASIEAEISNVNFLEKAAEWGMQAEAVASWPANSWSFLNVVAD